MLSDALDDFNTYIVASVNEQIVGFISVTPPGHGRYSIDKYLSRDELPFPCDESLFEARLLTVIEPRRGTLLAPILMYAALRWIEAHGGSRLVAIGRQEVLDIYLRTGLEPLGKKVHSGAVTFELLSATTDALQAGLARWKSLIQQFREQTDWQLNVPFNKSTACFHGGSFFEAIGVDFDALDRRHNIINADVLDAWFSPSPKVLSALDEHLPWLLRTSPPTGCEGMVHAIARVRGVREQCILPGAGSSDLIFLALRHWLTASSRVLILDPMYGEYEHVLKSVIGCQVDKLLLDRAADYELNLTDLQSALALSYDLVVLVNPNSPTGRHTRRDGLERVLEGAPKSTRIWIDETYVEYVGSDQSLERFATRTENVVICKSMSKVYALSGARAAYLCASEPTLQDLRAITPPWAVSLPGQVAAVLALEDPEYYAARYEETHANRRLLVDALQVATDLEIIPSVTSFLLCHLRPSGPSAATVLKRCSEQGVFLRDVRSMGTQFGDHALRIAVKDESTNRRIVSVLAKAQLS